MTWIFILVILIQHVTKAKIGVSLRVFLMHFALFLFFFILVHDVILFLGLPHDSAEHFSVP
jgi:hypothetical protein